ncbi:Glycosyl hydrolase, family 13, catalytic domain [Penicillium camemberti]|uniref:Alpha-amylase n=1 Tax=Penicillium camemberti (strain FM 013) TaxID=1429867 RepID=A0A0G4NZA7_PENC3|nr:Glycosyl hydrolase, family 13, catalytic domain [Penicillium camemberti]
MKLSHTLTAFLLPLICNVSAADVKAWKSRNIYFALTDRIARGSDDTGGDACGNLGNYCGGTFQGLESKLDYIKGMGFDAIWITPVIANAPGGYHGYWAQDLYSINENYGTADDLKSLVDAAHEKGIYVMADVVANHMGGPISDNKPEPLNQESAYHSACTIDYSSQDSVENCRIADDLPDVNTQSTEIRELFQTWVKWLVTEYGFDGLRIDTVKHVEKDFWSAFSSAAGVYTIGEVWDGDPTYLAGYANDMDGLLNYAVYYPVNNFYQQKGSSQDIVDMHDKIDSAFPDPSALGTFIDNHDNARWLSVKNDKSLLANALAYVILARGIPIVYYGTEQGYAGGNDPANREDLWRSNFSTDADLYKTISLLSAARTAAGGLADNDHVHLYIADTAYAWSRAGGDLIVLTSNSGSGSTAEHCFDSKKPGGTWKSTLGEGTVTADDAGKVCISISNGQPAVLVAST